MKKITSLAAMLILLLPGLCLHSQSNEKVFIRLVQPTRETSLVQSSKQFISGSTCKGCEVTVNGAPAKVYSSGGFAFELNLTPGENSYTIIARSGANTATKKISFRYSIPAPPEPVKTFDIASIQVIPEGHLVVQPGDKLSFRVKAQPGKKLTVNGNTPLYEMPLTARQTMPGIYQGEYVVQANDSFPGGKLLFQLADTSGKIVSKRAEHRISMLDTASSGMIVTKGRLAHLLFGFGEDRLGGAKIGYIDSLIPLRVTGKVKDLYRVQLSKFRTAYIPDDVVEWLPRGTTDARSLTGNWRVYGDSVADYLTINLDTRLPYQTMQLLDPSRIVVDIFGATNNTNWITQMESAREIKRVSYEQIEDEVLRVTIDLRHQQHWGYQVFYRDNRLVLRVRRQPEQLDLRNLRIAVDAGHGGGNTGASGPTGSREKEIALDVALKVKKALQYQGAKVIMTRNTETFVDNKERILLYRDSLPDILISIHLNSSSDPINVGGTGTFYRYIGFKAFSHDIYKRLLELGLKEYGNTGSFNFMLNSPTEYPNALVEMLFISNPEEEALILDPVFQQNMADKIVAGIKDFLERCRQDQPE